MYTLKLNAAQIKTIFKALSAYEQPLTDKMEGNEGKGGYNKQIYDKAKREIEKIDPLCQSIAEQIAHQNPQ